MRVIRDVYSGEGRAIVERMISRHGCSAEHTYHCFIEKINEVGMNGAPYVYVIEDTVKQANDNAKSAKSDVHDYMGVLATFEPKYNDYKILTEILAPQKMRATILKEFLDNIFSLERMPRKVWVELEGNTRRDVLKILKNTDYKCTNIAYTLIWPVFDMKIWDGDLMQGGEWKDMRYYWNKFFREHKVEFVTADKVDKQELKNLVYEWKKNRTNTDRAYTDYYVKAIDAGFEGYDVTRIMLVDGMIGAITAGFSPRKGYYYSSIGLYNTGIPRCNEIANMDDLINLKKLGYGIVDFGGIEKKGLEFKKKFRPTSYYKTHVFSIVRKDA